MYVQTNTHTHTFLCRKNTPHLFSNVHTNIFLNQVTFVCVLGGGVNVDVSIYITTESKVDHLFLKDRQETELIHADVGNFFKLEKHLFTMQIHLFIHNLKFLHSNFLTSMKHFKFYIYFLKAFVLLL